MEEVHLAEANASDGTQHSPPLPPPQADTSPPDHMIDIPIPPSSSSSSRDGEEINSAIEALQSVQPTTPPSPAPKKKPSASVTYAQVANRLRASHVGARQQAKEVARATRSLQVKTAVNPKETIYGPATMEHQLAIRFNPREVPEAELYLALFSQWRVSEEVTDYSDGIGYYGFSSQEDKEHAMANPLKLRTGVEIDAHPLKQAKGKTIRIRAEHAPLVTANEIKDKTTKLFLDAVPGGRILEFSRVRIPTEFGTCGRSPFEFVLEIPYATPIESVRLPRVAVIECRNVVFSWQGVAFCYHCAAPDHLKQDCPHSRSANIRKAIIPGTIFDYAIDTPLRRLAAQHAAMARPQAPAPPPTSSSGVAQQGHKAAMTKPNPSSPKKGQPSQPKAHSTVDQWHTVPPATATFSFKSPASGNTQASNSSASRHKQSKTRPGSSPRSLLAAGSRAEDDPTSSDTDLKESVATTSATPAQSDRRIAAASTKQRQLRADKEEPDMATGVDRSPDAAQGSAIAPPNPQVHGVNEGDASNTTGVPISGGSFNCFSLRSARRRNNFFQWVKELSGLDALCLQEIDSNNSVRANPVDTSTWAQELGRPILTTRYCAILLTSNAFSLHNSLSSRDGRILSAIIKPVEDPTHEGIRITSVYAPVSDEEAVAPLSSHHRRSSDEGHCPGYH
ncbi:hypothetical protein DFQ27_002935 [Actinomortierella ambigua]|uniref:CCHC-type domain-containing protein n=1 Tax=Actinomortierella ambigua TaxID=1343610 RepID=A0A9P6Q8Z1_9FUNG|nr:hypothetical protein DFQ27_002935 [Actinomortierella ambigua]